MGIVEVVQGTTPDIVLNVPGHDLTGKTVEVYIASGYCRMMLTNDRLGISFAEGVSVVAFQLTQRETLKMPVGQYDIQIRYIGPDGWVPASRMGAAKISVLPLAVAVPYRRSIDWLNSLRTPVA